MCVSCAVHRVAAGYSQLQDGMASEGSIGSGFSRMAIGSKGLCSSSGSSSKSGQSVARPPPPHRSPGVQQPGSTTQSSSSASVSRSAGRSIISRNAAALVSPSSRRQGSESKSSSAAQRLVKAQAKTLSGILEDVRAAGPQNYVKQSHWAWYVWPTTKEGISDPLNTAVKGVADVVFVLGAPTLGTWTALLEVLAAALRARGSRRVFPSIDHGRIEFFLREWAEYREKMPDRFASAFDQFAQAWTDASR